MKRRNGGPAAARPNGTINPKVVGKTALSEPDGQFLRSGQHPVLIAEQTTVSHTNPTRREKLCPYSAWPRRRGLESHVTASWNC